MKKVVFLVITIIVIIVLVFIGYSFFISKTTARGALQITSDPESKVYLNGKEIGRTPLCICGEDTVSDEFQKANLTPLFDAPVSGNLLPTGEYTIRLVSVKSGFSEFQDKITIGKSVLTVVDRTFGVGAGSDGSVIMLEKIGKSDIELAVSSIPDNAHVSLDGESIGNTPLKYTDIIESDHELVLSKSGYVDKGVRIKAVAGYRLIARIYMGVDEQSITGQKASQSDESVSADESDKTDNLLSIESVIILETGTGFLRVREEGSLAGVEVGQVTPGESYPLLGEETGWYQIEYADGKTGWISSTFAEKKE